MSAKEVRLIPVSMDTADGMAERLAALRATVECIATSIEEEQGIAGSAAEALTGVVTELERIYCDLDVCTWAKHEAKEVTT